MKSERDSRPLRDRRIGVLMGGVSAERDVSIKSGTAIYKSLLSQEYNAVSIDVREESMAEVVKEEIDAAFLALHGGTGENGAMQGMLEVLGIPYTGSGILASALAMDKELSKKLFDYHGFAVAPFMIVRRGAGAVNTVSGGEPDVTGAFISSALPRPPFDLPWVIKPTAEGSSIGVEIVRDEAGLPDALETAFRFGNRVIIEKFIPGREVHIGLLGDRVLGGVEVRPSREFYNYEAKYTSGLTDYILPPEVSSAAYDRAAAMAVKANSVLGCSGATRVDFIVDASDTPYILEVNTLPGMTETSLLPKIAGAAGMNFNNLIEEILKLAIKEKD